MTLVAYTPRGVRMSTITLVGAEKEKPQKGTRSTKSKTVFLLRFLCLFAANSNLTQRKHRKVLYLLWRRRPSAPIALNPEPRRKIVAGSGTAPTDATFTLSRAKTWSDEENWTATR